MKDRLIFDRKTYQKGISDGQLKIMIRLKNFAISLAEDQLNADDWGNAIFNEINRTIKKLTEPPKEN